MQVNIFILIDNSLTYMCIIKLNIAVFEIINVYGCILTFTLPKNSDRKILLCFLLLR